MNILIFLLVFPMPVSHLKPNHISINFSKFLTKSVFIGFVFLSCIDSIINSSALILKQLSSINNVFGQEQ